jgi:hypothetical protein
MNKSVILIFVLWGLASVKAFSVPLFGETAGTIKQGVLTLYKDHENPKKVYFFPNSTRFSVDQDNVPLFNFVYWGLGVAGTANDEKGGYMTLSTHLASDKDQAAALEVYMKDHPEMEIAVLPIKSSIIGISTTAATVSSTGGPLPSAPLRGLFTEFNFAKVGGRAEDEIGVNAVLTATGARAFKALLTNDKAGSLIKFDYCYTVQGYGPNLNATVTVNMRRVYDFFEAKTTVGWFWNPVTIKSATESLNENHDISIIMNGGDAKQWESLNTVAQTITTRLFKPELEASPIAHASANTYFSLNIGNRHKEELKSEVWNFVRRDLENREFCTAVVIKDLKPYINQLVTNAD